MNSKKSLIVFISGSGTHLQNFIDHQEKLNYQIKLVISNNPNAYGLERAKKAGIESLVINHKNYQTREEFEKQIVVALANYQYDLIVLAGFMRIFSAYFFSEIHYPVLNIHPSLLPKHKGLHTHKKAINSSDRYHGASVHLVNQMLDSGQVIKQIKIPIFPNDSEITLAERLLKFEHKIYLQVLKWFIKGKLVIQDNLIYLDGKLLDFPIIEIKD